MPKTFPIFNYFGGKYYMADFIIEYFPSRYCDLDYHEPCLGAGSVFLNKRPSKNETISDINPNIVNLWRTVRDHCKMLQSALENIEYTEANWKLWCGMEAYTNFDAAIKTYVKYRMSRSGRGDTFGYSNRQRGGQDESLNKWENGIKNLSTVSTRCRDVDIKCQTVLDVLQRSTKNDFIYIDPPYLADVRVAASVYEYEMTISDHINMLVAATKSPAKIMISMYPDDFYNYALDSWRCLSKDLPNHSGESKVKQDRREMIWMNYTD